MEERKLPKLRDIYDLTSEIAKLDQFKQIVNNEPKKAWIKKNPFANDSKYIPIGIIDTLLDLLFMDHKIEIRDKGVSFNGVFVVVRVHVQSFVNEKWTYHDGIGACQIQTKKGSSPADLMNINNNALQMAYPMAKSFAVKDACEEFGKLFGRDLNRKDVLEFVGQDNKPKSVNNTNENKERDRVIEAIKDCKTIEELQGFSVLVAQYELELEYENKEIELTNKK